MILKVLAMLNAKSRKGTNTTEIKLETTLHMFGVSV
jgi:hypothetical protein